MVDINLIPREYKLKREKFSGIVSRTVGAVFALFILSLLAYGGLLLYQNKLNTDLESINNAIKNLEIKRDFETEEIMVDLDKKLKVLKDMFEEHLYWSKIVAKTEDLIIPEVYFSGAHLSLTEDKINFGFTGNALTYTILARQMISFQEEPNVENVSVSDIGLSAEGGIDFNLEVIFSKDILLGLENND